MAWSYKYKMVNFWYVSYIRIVTQSKQEWKLLQFALSNCCIWPRLKMHLKMSSAIWWPFSFDLIDLCSLWSIPKNIAHWINNLPTEVATNLNETIYLFLSNPAQCPEGRNVFSVHSDRSTFSKLQVSANGLSHPKLSTRWPSDMW